MGYYLAEHVSFCLAGDRAVFLDARRDRYFRLGPRLEAAFASLLSPAQAPERGVEELIRTGLIGCTDDERPPIQLVSVQHPARSILEEVHNRPPLGRGIVAEIAYALISTRLRLKSRPLYIILDRIRKRKLRYVDLSIELRAGEQRNTTLNLAASFNKFRHVVPISSVCLLDSLALIDLLASHGIFPNLVFGVTLNPFIAHCWVQYHDVVLNDALDHATVHTPILVI